MKNTITISALLAMLPLTVNAYVDNIYGNGGVETKAFATEAEAIAAAKNEMSKIEVMNSPQLAFTLRTPSKDLDYSSLEIVETEVKARQDSGMYKGFVDVEYRFSRYSK